MSAAFSHSIDIRYGECDQQGVVFNANYLVYVDDTMDHWIRSFAGDEWVSTWDVMLKTVRITWDGPANWPEVMTVDCGVARWGRTSFDVAFRLHVAGRPVADALVTYVSVDVGTHRPSPPPQRIVEAMGPTIALPESLR